MNTDDLKQVEAKHIMQTYKRLDIVLEKGEGCYVYDTAGNKYLDCLGGIATCTVGHANPAVTKAIADQAGQLVAVSNLYYTEPQVKLAQKLSKLTGLQKCFFSHAGADANEAAIKLAKKITGKKSFIAFKEAFHGRTTGSLAMTWKAAYKEPFLPLAPYVSFADFGDIASVKALITDDTAAVFVEPIQGEAGIIVPPADFLQGLRELCTKHDILLIADEVQTGVGRTGTFLACQQAGITPDIVTLAKGLANGLPIGVCLSDHELTRGDHGSTLGGNNLSAAAALATLDYIEVHDLMRNAQIVGDYLMGRMRELQATTPLITEVRGRGLMIAIELADDIASAIVDDAIKHGLLCNAATPSTLRFLPPLTLSKVEADECMTVLGAVVHG